MRPHMRGIAWDTAHTLADSGWNARTLHLYSHATTHMDAPRHFFEQGQSIEHLDLAKCVGPAWVIDVGALRPRELITVDHLTGMVNKNNAIAVAVECYAQICFFC